jgi:hypothetical protein
MKRYLLLLIIIVAATGTYVWSRGGEGEATPPEVAAPTEKALESAISDPFSIKALQERQYDGGEIKVEQELGDRSGFKSYIVSYKSDGLKLRSLLNVPTSPKPAGGYPALILNHGYIPPRQYDTITSYRLLAIILPARVLWYSSLTTGAMPSPKALPKPLPPRRIMCMMS